MGDSVVRLPNPVHSGWWCRSTIENGKFEEILRKPSNEVHSCSAGFSGRGSFQHDQCYEEMLGGVTRKDLKLWSECKDA